VRALTSGNDDARNIINALFERPYRIVHVAGQARRATPAASSFRAAPTSALPR
jgi:hypothetical protein